MNVDETERCIINNETCHRKREFPKRGERSSERNERDRIAPLLPYRPPIPVLTVISEISRSRSASLVLTKMQEKSYSGLYRVSFQLEEGR